MRGAWLPGAVLAAALAGCGGGAPSAPAAAPAPVPVLAPGTSPAWAPGLTHEQSRAFLAVVLEHFTVRGERIRVDDGWVIPQGDAAGMRFGLTNVAQRCAAAPQAQWPEVIAEHFESIRKIQSDQTAWKQRLESWETAKDYLRLRLYPPDFGSEPEMERVLRRVDLAETLTMVVFDLPTSIRTVTKENVAGWGVAAGRVWEVATANERRRTIPAPETLDLGPAGPLQAFSEDSFFVSSLALRLDQLPGEPPPHGWLVGVPTRDLVVLYAVEDLRVLQAINKLAELVPKMERDGPGAVSPHLYWWDGTTHHVIHVKREGAQMSVAPSAAFTQLLNTLAAGDSGK